MAFTHAPGEQLARVLCDSTNGVMTRAYFVGSGSEAMEAALKMARQYFVEVGQPARTKFIAREGSYHGITLGSLGVSGHLGRRKIYEPILSPQVSFVSGCNGYRGMHEGESEEEYVRRLKMELDEEFVKQGGETVCAFVAEPVVGAALGCVPALPGYFVAVKEVCEKHGALMICDEIMCGIGRTGTMHAWQQEGIEPDIQTLGKGLGGGYIPLAAMLLNKRVVGALEGGSGAFSHGHTFQGHPVACAAALEVQRILEEEKLVENVRKLGPLLEQELKGKLRGHPNVGDIRGKGFFWGIELLKERERKVPFELKEAVAWGVHELGLTMGIQVYPGTGAADGIRGDQVIISPPLNVSREEIALIVELVAKVIICYFERKCDSDTR